jgi:hypothetical protein
MDPMDEYLGKRIQNWAAGHKPPVNGRMRLLRSAAQVAYLQSRGGAKNTPEDHLLVRLLKTNLNRKRHHDYSSKFFDWTIVYSFEMSLVNLKLMF